MRPSWWTRRVAKRPRSDAPFDSSPNAFFIPVMKSLLFLLSSLAVVHSSFAATPNFVLINIDDLGYADIGPFGAKISTPNLDRMAKEGMKLTSHYAAPVCSPSRAAMMTGR